MFYCCQIDVLVSDVFRLILPEAVLRIRIRMILVSWIRIRNPHPESAFQMRIPDADADRDKLRKNSADDNKIKTFKYFVGLL
jgi:hypothetical protein